MIDFVVRTGIGAIFFPQPCETILRNDSGYSGVGWRKRDGILRNVALAVNF